MKRGETAFMLICRDLGSCHQPMRPAQFGRPARVEHHAEIFTVPVNLGVGVAVEAENVPGAVAFEMPTALGRSTSTSCRTAFSPLASNIRLAGLGAGAQDGTVPDGHRASEARPMKAEEDLSQERRYRSRYRSAMGLT